MVSARELKENFTSADHIEGEVEESTGLLMQQFEVKSRVLPHSKNSRKRTATGWTKAHGGATHQAPMNWSFNPYARTKQTPV